MTPARYVCSSLIKPEYGDGEQVRDFIYVQDAVAMTLFFHESSGDQWIVQRGVRAGALLERPWRKSLFAALNREPVIEYIEMPDSIRDQYQYHTCANIDKIRDAGYDCPILSLEDAVADYVNHYLLPGKHLVL